MTPKKQTTGWTISKAFVGKGVLALLLMVVGASGKWGCEQLQAPVGVVSTEVAEVADDLRVHAKQAEMKHAEVCERVDSLEYRQATGAVRDSVIHMDVETIKEQVGEIGRAVIRIETKLNGDP